MLAVSTHPSWIPTTSRAHSFYQLEPGLPRGLQACYDCSWRFFQPPVSPFIRLPFIVLVPAERTLANSVRLGLLYHQVQGGIYPSPRIREYVHPTLPLSSFAQSFQCSLIPTNCGHLLTKMPSSPCICAFRWLGDSKCELSSQNIRNQCLITALSQGYPS